MLEDNLIWILLHCTQKPLQSLHSWQCIIQLELILIWPLEWKKKKESNIEDKNVKSYCVSDFQLKLKTVKKGKQKKISFSITSLELDINPVITPKQCNI